MDVCRKDDVQLLTRNISTPLLRVKFYKPILGLALGMVLSLATPASGLDGVIIANDSVPVTQISASLVKDIYVGKTMYWADGQEIVLVVAGGATDATIQEASGMSSTQFRTHWQRLGFSGRGQPPKKAESVEKAIAIVRATKGAVAIVPSGTDAKGVKSLEVK